MSEMFYVPVRFEKLLFQGLMDARRFQIHGVTGWDVVSQIIATKRIEGDQVCFELEPDQVLFLGQMAVRMIPAMMESASIIEKYKSAVDLCNQTISQQNEIIDTLTDTLIRQDSLVDKYENMVMQII